MTVLIRYDRNLHSDIPSNHLAFYVGSSDGEDRPPCNMGKQET
jgi:hypothetical protein